MDLKQLLTQLTPDIYRNLKRAVEIGKWPDGRVLTREQRELCMQAVIAYEVQHLDEHERTGFIDRGSKAQGEVCDDEQAPAADQPEAPAADQPVKWLH
jgi:uncharacterized protein